MSFYRRFVPSPLRWLLATTQAQRSPCRFGRGSVLYRRLTSKTSFCFAVSKSSLSLDQTPRQPMGTTYTPSSLSAGAVAGMLSAIWTRHLQQSFGDLPSQGKPAKIRRLADIFSDDWRIFYPPVGIYILPASFSRSRI